MKLFVKEKCDVKETEVEIRCQIRDREVDDLITGIKNAANTILGEKENGDTCQVPVVRILYFEAVEGRVFAYLDNEVLKIKNTLYEVEDSYKSNHFVRISKSAVVNLRTVTNIRPEEGRRVRLELKNREHLIVSKNYVGCLKKALGMKEAR